jgi:phosphatidylserine decarboxylase
MVSGFLAAWREVKAIVLTLIGATLLALWARKPGLTLLSTALLGWVFYFFRDPERALASPSTDLILAPADGRVMAVEQVDEPDFIQGPAQRISIFLSLFDVHVQRSPCAGVVQFMRYQSGDFVPAFLKEAHRNEANLIGLKTPYGPLVVKQIAGILARRIVCWATLGDELSPGQRLGLIKFGSRVDLFLPPTVEVQVHVGQQVYGGQTVVAKWRA